MLLKYLTLLADEPSPTRSQSNALTPRARCARSGASLEDNTTPVKPAAAAISLKMFEVTWLTEQPAAHTCRICWSNNTLEQESPTGPTPRNSFGPTHQSRYAT